LFKKALLAYLLICLPFLASSQASNEKAALKHLEKGRFVAAYAKLKRALLKDSTNVTANYGLARYFFAESSPDFQLDSVRHYLHLAHLYWSKLQQSERQKFSRQQIDSIQFVFFQRQLDSAAYMRAKSIHTVAGYQFFLDHYVDSEHETAVIALRDEVAFQTATASGTSDAYFDYLSRYPDAEYAGEAKRRYEYLLYKEKTSDIRLTSFERFIKEFPESPHREDAEYHVFQLSTASGVTNDFFAFIKNYPKSKWVKSAWNVLYHLLIEERREIPFPQGDLGDSLRHVHRLGQQYLVPFLHNDKFGFMTETGEELLIPHQERIDEAYRCGNIIEDVIALSDRIISCNGVTIWKGKANDMDELGYGFVAVETESGINIVHKSGMQISNQFFEEVRLLNGKAFALQDGSKWGLATLTGKVVMQFEYDDIFTIGNVVVFRKGNVYSLSTLSNVMDTRHEQKKISGGFDEVKKISNRLLWVRAGEFEGVLTDGLEIHVKLAKHKLTAFPGAILAVASAGQSAFNREGRVSPYAGKVEINGPWVAFKKDQRWGLFHPLTMETLAPNRFDSLLFYGPFAVGINKDTLRVFGQQRQLLTLLAPAAFEFLPGQDSAVFLMVEQAGKKTVYSTDGIALFTGNYDRIQYAGEGFFIVHKKEKKGVVDKNGNPILPVEYDAIGTPKQGIITLLKAMKFGQFNYHTSSLIRPEYDKNIQWYNEHIFTAFKSDGFGFVDSKNKALTKFEFKEIKFWKDSVALVKRLDGWVLYNFYSGSTLTAPMAEVKFIRDDNEEKILQLKQGNYYGALSNRKGLIIPVKFSDLVNVGSPERPTYFTEKHVEEASLYVVIYYNHEGKFIRKEVYEQDDYVKIFCSEFD